MSGHLCVRAGRRSRDADGVGSTFVARGPDIDSSVLLESNGASNPTAD